MRQSQLFTKTRKEAPSDEVAKNAQLLIRAGYVYKEMAGVYAYMPLGLRVLNKIINIIREEINGIGGQELTLTALQQKETWEPTNQWSDDQVDVWFKTKLKNETELGLAVTHEAALTKVMKDYISSYRDLPKYIYQFQTKFRNETRAKSGIMRTREFLMKDLYSFSKSKEEHDIFYEKVKGAYQNIFNRVGIGEKTYLTAASGGMFSKFSHEFQTITDAGEDIIYIDQNIYGKGLNTDLSVDNVFNKEIYTFEPTAEIKDLDKSFKEEKAVEVGNIFTLATRFSDALDLKYKNEAGEDVSVFMGSYGIGPARVMGAVVETLSDDKGIVWPESIAPFKVHLVALGENIPAEAEQVYTELTAAGIEVLFDDRAGIMPGEKFADADLIGIPHRIVVSERSLKNGGAEYKSRTSAESEIVALTDIAAKISHA